eukprot:GAHX01000147.1.p1 GENE.GAHX01000147.1~~GAHX01000147.1.p1  ORF type:complete len:143 (-),score=40.09 GAHX01000147.1:40-426(-)
MGKIRIKAVKTTAKRIIEKNYDKVSLDYDHNKLLIEEFATFPSVGMRNKVAGYLTKLYKRLQKGPIPGVSLRMHEEARERDLAALSVNTFGVDDINGLSNIPDDVLDMAINDFPKMESYLKGFESSRR